MRRLITPFLLSVLAATACGQNSDTANGYIPGHTYVLKDIDRIDVASGNVSLTIPLLSFKEQGPLSIDYSLDYYAKHFTFVFVDYAYGTDFGWTWTDPMFVPKAYLGAGLGDTGYAGVHLATNQDWRRTTTSEYFGPALPEIITPDGGIHILLNDINGMAHSVDGTGLGDAIDTSGVIHNTTTEAPSGTSVPLFQYGAYANTPRVVFGEDQRPSFITDALNRSLPWPDLYTGSIGSAATNYSGCAGVLPIAEAVNVSFPNGIYLFCYVDIPLSTNMNAVLPTPLPTSTYDYRSLYPEFQGTRRFLQSVRLPNGRSWMFEYQDRDPGDPMTINYGTLTKVTYPTGGSVAYKYGLQPLCGPIPGNYYHTFTSRRLIQKTESEGSSTPNTWNYLLSVGAYQTLITPTQDEPNVSYIFDNTTVTVQNPDGSSVVHQFRQDLGICAGQEVARMEIDSDGVTLASHTYGTTTIGFPVVAPASDGSNNYVGGSYSYAPFITFDVLPNGQAESTERHYDNEKTVFYWNQDPTKVSGEMTLSHETEKWIYDYGVPTSFQPTGNPYYATSGQLLQHTLTTYIFQSNPLAKALNYLDLVETQTIDGDGGNSTQIRNHYSISQVSSTGGGPSQSDPLYIPELISKDSRIDATSNATITYDYDSMGAPVSKTDPNGNMTAYTYDPASIYVLSTKLPVINSVPATSSTTYNLLTGTVKSMTDVNNNTTSFSYDEMLRPTSIVAQDPSVIGSVTVCYGEDVNQHCSDAEGNDGTNTIYASVVQNSATGAVIRKKQTFDGFGRPNIKSYRDDVGWIRTEISFDKMGRTQAVTRPHREGVPATGLTWIDYDGLGREKSVKQEDGNGIVISPRRYEYNDPQIDIWDGDNHHSRQQMDGLGQLVAVWEPDATNNPLIKTSYKYDALGNLVDVNQQGLSGAEVPRSRHFTYDSLSRLTSSRNPENGFSTLPCSGTSLPWSICNHLDNNGNLISRMDARGFSLNMSYDAWNRLLDKTAYLPTGEPDPGTPSTCNRYDFPSLGSNYLGELGAQWTQKGACANTFQSVQGSSAILTSRVSNGFDIAGRLISETNCILGSCHPSGIYHYDLAGNLLQYFNQQVNVLQGYDVANRLNSVSAVDPGTAVITPLYSVTSRGPSGPITIDLGPAMTKLITYDSLQRTTSETTIKH